MKFNSYKIVSKCSKKYELNCHNQVTHANFAPVHNNIINKIVDAGIAEELVEPEYVNIFRNNAEKKDSFRYKISYKIKYLDYCLIVDELSRNISQKKYDYT